MPKKALRVVRPPTPRVRKRTDREARAIRTAREVIAKYFAKRT